MTANTGLSQTPVPGLEPQPISPQKKSSGLLKGCLLVAALLAVVAVLALAAAGWYGWTHGGDLFAKGLELSKLQFMTALTPDHTPEQRAEVEKAYGQMAKKCRQEGFIQFMAKHEKSLRLTQEINADNKITPDESQLWVEQWNSELGPEPSASPNP